MEISAKTRSIMTTPYPFLLLFQRTLDRVLMDDPSEQGDGSLRGSCPATTWVKPTAVREPTGKGHRGKGEQAHRDSKVEYRARSGNG